MLWGWRQGVRGQVGAGVLHGRSSMWTKEGGVKEGSRHRHRRSHVLAIVGSGPPLPGKKNEDVCCGMGSEHGQAFKE